MSQDTTVRVEGLSKVYRVDVSGAAATAGAAGWLDTLVRSPLHKLRHGAAHSMHTEDFSALDDVSFELQQGEVLGIVGRNGAGKSTLLKILSRITEPTRGYAEIRGRVGSLLEVGTGFHNELTGRENVFLNASILGMGRNEILRRFDEIVEFAGVGRFIDTPVKRYSSGMRVRLGFAVAAHFDPEVLIVDEVLAVGDVDFQQKCLGKMSESAKSGRTVLFVSHNLTAVRNLCPRSILLEQGKLVADSDTEEVINLYLGRFDTQAGGRGLDDFGGGRKGSGEARMQSVELLTLDEKPASCFPMGEGMIVRIDVLANETVAGLQYQVAIVNDRGEVLCRVSSYHVRNWTFSMRKGERTTVDCVIPRMNLGPDRYMLTLQLLNLVTAVDTTENAVSFEVEPADVFGTGRVPWGKNVLYLDADWKLAETPVND